VLGCVGQICEISTVIFVGKFIVVVNSEISSELNKKESLLDWFFQGHCPKIFVSNVWLNYVYYSFIYAAKFQIA
jgi:hypothetical protein